MSRLTIRAEEDGVKAVWYGERDVFLEGEIGYAEADKLAHYEDLEEQGRLIELPCEKVYCIINYNSPKYAFIDSIPIETMLIYDLKHIDNGNIFFSTKEKAEAKLEEWRVRNELETKNGS